MDDTNNQLKELYKNANKDVQAYLLTDELDGAVGLFGKIYKLPVSLYMALKNTITLILLGAIQPEDAVSALQNNCQITEEDAYSLAKDLDQTIFQKIRLTILRKDTSEVKTLVFEDENSSKEELRKEILDTTNRVEKKEEVEEKIIEPYQKIQQVNLQPGSRSQLLEQLQVLDTIPNDAEVEDRLNKIKAQIASLDSKKDPHELDSNIVLPNFMFEEKGEDIAKAEVKSATYSTAPTKYNVDPYREIGDE